MAASAVAGPSLSESSSPWRIRKKHWNEEKWNPLTLVDLTHLVYTENAKITIAGQLIAIFIQFNISKNSYLYCLKAA